MEIFCQPITSRGSPRYLRSDNGPEFVGRAILEPTHTAAKRGDESFNGKERTSRIHWHPEYGQRQLPTKEGVRTSLGLGVDVTCRFDKSRILIQPQ